MTGVNLLECTSCLLIQLLLLFISINKLLLLISSSFFLLVFGINLLLLEEGREEDVVHVVLFEILGPVLSQLVCKVVCLVYQQQELLFALILVHIFNVLLQI